MRNISRFKAFAIGCLLFLLLSCSNNDNGVDPGNSPQINISQIFYGTKYQVYSVKMDWSPDGNYIVFAGGPSGNIWKVQSIPNSTPVSVTDNLSTGDGDGGYTPGYLSDSRIGYYLGWLQNDQKMHIMASSLNQINNSPAPSVLHEFNGFNVGLGLNSASSPNELSISGDGLRAVGQWNNTYTMDWSGQQLVSVDVSDMIGSGVNFMISRDGNKITYQDKGEIKWIYFQGGDSNLIGKGSYPSWNGDGTLLGFVDETSKSYKIFDFKTNKTSSYSIPGSQIFQYPVLSWDGKKIAFRRFGTTESGISVGEFVE
jgi:hypothetical protein